MINEGLRGLAEEFKSDMNIFIQKCDVIEATGVWDTDEYGQMEAYFTNDIMCIVISLMSADGTFSDSETKYMRDIFGYDMTKEEVQEIYRNTSNEISDIFKNGISESITLLKNIDTEMAQDYKKLIDSVCDIIIGSDGVLSNREVDMAESIKSLTV